MPYPKQQHIARAQWTPIGPWVDPYTMECPSASCPSCEAQTWHRARHGWTYGRRRPPLTDEPQSPAAQLSPRRATLMAKKTRASERKRCKRSGLFWPWFAPRYCFYCEHQVEPLCSQETDLVEDVDD
jgi:hypothetical protein